jgi:hypothetical protein
VQDGLGHACLIAQCCGGQDQPAIGTPRDQPLALQSAEDGGVAEAAGILGQHQGGADMEVVAVRPGQAAQRHAAIGQRLAAAAGRQLLQDGQGLELQRVELQGIGAAGQLLSPAW